MIRGEKMIKCEVIAPFTLEKINEIKIIKKRSDEFSKLLSVGDIFECDEKMYDYLTKANAYKTSFIKAIEIIPEKKTTKKKKTKID